MPDKFTDLPHERRYAVLNLATEASDRRGCFLEKDIWGV